jgi:hypothetical protein
MLKMPLDIQIFEFNSFIDLTLKLSKSGCPEPETRVSDFYKLFKFGHQHMLPSALPPREAGSCAATWLQLVVAPVGFVSPRGELLCCKVAPTHGSFHHAQVYALCVM